MTAALFPAHPVLDVRLGTEVFDTVPQSPGVYRFFDRYGELLYVGKAKNLRRRLFQYKRARSGQVSRKVAKLISRIERLEWQVTRTEQEALLLENRLIRGERPPFNHANKQPETYYFVYLKPEPKGLEFRLAMRIHEETDDQYWYGCFKGHAIVRRSFGCLLQLLWMAGQMEYNPLHLPVQLTRRLTPMRYHLPWGEGSPLRFPQLPEMLCLWMKGESCELLDWLAVRLDYSLQNTRSYFQVRYFEQSLDCLKTFYDRKLKVHHRLRGDRPRIEQEEIDDVMVYCEESQGNS